MILKELICKIDRVPITIMLRDKNYYYTKLYRGESNFCRLSEWEENCLNVEYIKPHKDNENELFIMVSEGE